MRGIILTAALSAAALAGCYTTGRVGYSAGYSSGYGGGAAVYATTPDLVSVSPGVQVVADYDEPVFYTDGFYWRFYDGFWYRSNNYANGWYFVERPPVTVLRIDRPYAYRHYRPHGYVARNRPRYRPAEVIVRDHRRPTYRAEPVTRREPYRAAPVRQAPPAAAPSAPPPAVRDHRDRRDAPPAARKDDRRDDRRDERRVRDHRN